MIQANLVPYERSPTATRHCVHFGPAAGTRRADPTMTRAGTTRGARGGRHQRPDLRLPGSHVLYAASRAADHERLLMFFGSSGDLGYLQRLVAEEGFRTKVLARKTLVEDGWQVEVMAPMMGVNAPWA